MEIIFRVAGPHARRFRKIAADYMMRIGAGDESLIDELQARQQPRSGGEKRKAPEGGFNQAIDAHLEDLKDFEDKLKNSGLEEAEMVDLKKAFSNTKNNR